jgi:hypothetical protein
MIAFGTVGCMDTQNTPQVVKKPASGQDRSGEAAVLKQLPLVDPQSITKDNGVAKAKELQDELMQESKRMAAARSSDGPK